MRLKYGHAQTAANEKSRAQKKNRILCGLVLAGLLLPVFTLLSGCAAVVPGSKTSTSSGTASFQLSPASVSFGQVTVGKQSTQTVTVSNTGTIGINITQMALSNSNFTVTGMTTPMALAVGQTATFTVAVNATAAGSLTGTLTASGDGGSTPVVVNLSATAVASQAQLAVSESSIGFGNVSVGTKSTNNLILNNNGTSDLNISMLTLAGADFTISGITTPKTISAGQSAQLTVTFDPATTGSVTGSLGITSSDPVNPSMTIPLTGTGTNAPTGELSANPTSVSFGSVTSGTTSNKQIVLTNTGTAAVNITSITSQGSGLAVSGVSTPATLNPSQTATINVAYDPTAVGSLTGTISISSNAGNSTLTIPVTGTGTAVPTGQLSANPTSLSFGTISTGTSSTKQIVLTNTGNASVNITSITPVGTGLTIGGVTLPATLSPTQTLTVDALFAPTTAGGVTGTISVVSNASNPTLTIQTSGTGAQAGLSLSPATYSFGSIVDGQTKSQSITITNTGTASLTIADLAVAGGAYSVSGMTTPATIAAGGTANFSVLFAPTTAGSQSGTVTITSNAPNSPNVLSLSGSGTAASVTLSSNPTSVSFTSVNAGSSSSKSVTITNSGNTSLTISSITVNAQNFAVSGITTPMALTAGQNATLNVTFSPSVSENITGNITVATTQGATSVIPVSGTGVQAGLTITPASANLGSVTVGGSPSSQTIQLLNSGTGTLTVSQVSVTGGGFTLGQLALPLNLGVGQSANLTVQFAPASAGTASGSITVVSNAPNSPALIGLTGTGIAATQTLSFSTTSISFGSVNTGSTATQNVTITNTGNASVSISGITESGSGFTLTGAGTPIALSAGQTTTFGVVYSPTTAGTNAGTVTVTSTASGSPATITLSGTGVAAATHSVTLGWAASSSTVSGYNVYRSTTSGSGYAKLNSSLVAGVSYDDTTVQNGTTYYYVVTSVDSSGTESSDSNQATAVIP
jgi:hypothetical protein